MLVPGLAFDPVIFQFQMDVACSRSPENPDTQVAHSEARKSVRTGSLQDFLRVEVLRRTVPGEAVQTATVRELIKHYANREGGVHFDPRGRSANHYIEQIRDSVGGDLRRTILACGLILIRALEPMAAALTLKDTPGSEGLDFTRIRP